MRASILVLALVGCVRQHDDGTIGQTEAQKPGATLAAAIESGAAAFGPVNAGAGVDSLCITLSGDQSDPDGDSIPNNATKTFNCTTTSLGYTGMLTGTEGVKDDQPSSIAWAFTGTANLHGSLTGPGGALATVDTAGNIVATQTTVAGPFALARTLDVTTVFKTSGGDLGGQPKTTTVIENHAWTITYTPMVMWTPGTIVITGSLAVAGMWNVMVDADTADAMLATPTPMKLDPACETRITAGTVTASYQGGGHGNTITVTWTGCGQSSTSYAQGE